MACPAVLRANADDHANAHVKCIVHDFFFNIALLSHQLKMAGTS